MRCFIQKIALFFILQIVLLSALLWSSGTQPNDFLGLANEKHARLRNLKDPRLVLVGGSNIVMGINSQVLQEELPEFSPANMSLTMALGLPFLLDEIRTQVRQGDVIVVIPEYHLLLAGRGVSASNSSFIAEMIIQRPEAAECLSTSAVLAFMDRGALSLMGQALRGCSWSTFCERVLPGKKRKKAAHSKNRHSQSFNEYGDAVFHYSLPAVGFRPMQKNNLSLDKLAETVSLLNEFSSFCAARGARVLMAYPPFPQPDQEMRAFLSEMDSRLRLQVNFPIIHSPSDHYYELDQFYNSYYHLNGSTVPLRTRRLAAELKTHLEQ